MLLRRVAGGILVIVLGIGCRGEASSPASKASQASPRTASSVFSDVPRTPRPQGGRAPVFWIGMDGLDWELLDRFAADGTMPDWKRLVSEGSAARLESFIPILSPIVWTTAATGMPPDVHRVLDFQETDPKTGAKVP